MKFNKLLLPAVFLLLWGCSVSDWELRPFLKYNKNPILEPTGRAWETKDVFNPAAWSDGKMVYLLYRAEDSSGIGKWNGTSRIGLATSSDGIHFERNEQPVLEPSEPWELPGGCEDPRLVRIDSTFYLTYTAYDGKTARLALATSTDLKHWKKYGPVFPDMDWSKSGAILPKQVNGKYWMYFGDTNIWAAYSTDLIHWTRIKKPVMKPRKNYFDSKLIEPGPPPVVSNRGILLLYNAADTNLVYRSGQVLFDPKDPTNIIKRSQTPFFRPETKLEQVGQVSNVVFIEGLVRFNHSWYLYYGMGDSGIGVAFSR